MRQRAWLDRARLGFTVGNNNNQFLLGVYCVLSLQKFYVISTANTPILQTKKLVSKKSKQLFLSKTLRNGRMGFQLRLSTSSDTAPPTQ